MSNIKVGDRVRAVTHGGYGRDYFVPGRTYEVKEVHDPRLVRCISEQGDALNMYVGSEVEAIPTKATRTYDLGSQNGRILAHLLSGNTITPLVAVGVFGAYRLAARIRELRQAGHKIKTTIKRDPNGKPYAEYSLRNAGRV
jgi:hypothetical protein